MNKLNDKNKDLWLIEKITCKNILNVTIPYTSFKSQNNLNNIY